jgi:hypothetical protein
MVVIKQGRIELREWWRLNKVSKWTIRNHIGHVYVWEVIVIVGSCVDILIWMLTNSS